MARLNEPSVDDGKTMSGGTVSDRETVLPIPSATGKNGMTDPDDLNTVKSKFEALTKVNQNVIKDNIQYRHRLGKSDTKIEEMMRENVDLSMTVTNLKVQLDRKTARDIGPLKAKIATKLDELSILLAELDEQCHCRPHTKPAEARLPPRIEDKINKIDCRDVPRSDGVYLTIPEDGPFKLPVQEVIKSPEPARDSFDSDPDHSPELGSPPVAHFVDIPLDEPVLTPKLPEPKAEPKAEPECSDPIERVLLELKAKISADKAAAEEKDRKKRRESGNVIELCKGAETVAEAKSATTKKEQHDQSVSLPTAEKQEVSSKPQNSLLRQMAEFKEFATKFKENPEEWQREVMAKAAAEQQNKSVAKPDDVDAATGFPPEIQAMLDDIQKDIDNGDRYMRRSKRGYVVLAEAGKMAIQQSMGMESRKKPGEFPRVVHCSWLTSLVTVNTAAPAKVVEAKADKAVEETKINNKPRRQPRNVSAQVAEPKDPRNTGRNKENIPPNNVAGQTIKRPDTPDACSPYAAEKNARADTPPPGSYGASLDGRMSRRARASVSYAEPSLRDKMRRPTEQLLDAVTGEQAGKKLMQQHFQPQRSVGSSFPNGCGNTENDDCEPYANPMRGPKYSLIKTPSSFLVRKDPRRAVSSPQRLQQPQQQRRVSGQHQRATSTASQKRPVEVKTEPQSPAPRATNDASTWQQPSPLDAKSEAALIKIARSRNKKKAAPAIEALMNNVRATITRPDGSYYPVPPPNSVRSILEREMREDARARAVAEGRDVYDFDAESPEEGLESPTERNSALQSFIAERVAHTSTAKGTTKRGGVRAAAVAGGERRRSMM